MEAIENERRNPRQTRSQKTVEIILDAAAQILSQHGEARFTTNHIAERAGVSIGTLYQYFKDKDAVLRQLSEREVVRLEDRMHSVVNGANYTSDEARARNLVRALIAFFAQRRRSKRIVMINLLMLVSSRNPVDRVKIAMDEIMRAWNQSGLSEVVVDETTMFVISHALLGVLRSAMLFDPELLDRSVLEDRLVHLVVSMIKYSARD